MWGVQFSFPFFWLKLFEGKVKKNTREVKRILKILKTQQKKWKKKKLIVSVYANISERPFDQRSQQHHEEGVLKYHRQTNKYPDMETRPVGSIQ